MLLIWVCRSWILIESESTSLRISAIALRSESVILTAFSRIRDITLSESKCGSPSNATSLLF